MLTCKHANLGHANISIQLKAKADKEVLLFGEFY